MFVFCWSCSAVLLIMGCVGAKPDEEETQGGSDSAPVPKKSGKGNTVKILLLGFDFFFFFF